MSKSRRTQRCLVLAAALASAGCGGDDEPGSDPAADAAEETVGVEPAASADTSTGDGQALPGSAPDADVSAAPESIGSAPDFGCPSGAAASEAVGVEVRLVPDEVMHGPDVDDGQFTLCPYEEVTDPPGGLPGSLTLAFGTSNPIEGLTDAGAQLDGMEPIEGVVGDIRWNPNGGLLAWSGELGVNVSMLGFEQIDRRSAAVALAQLVL